MYELKRIGKVLTSKSVGTGPSSYGKRIYWAAISQRLRNTALQDPIKSMKNLMTSIRNRTRDFPTCSVTKYVFSMFINFKWCGQNSAVFICVNFKFSFEEWQRPRKIQGRWPPYGNVNRHAQKHATPLTMTFDEEGRHNCEECTLSALRRWQSNKHWSAYIHTYSLHGTESFLGR